MKIEQKQIKVREVFENYADNGDDVSSLGPALYEAATKNDVATIC